MVLAAGALILSYAVAILAWLMLRRTGAFTSVVAGASGVGVLACSALVVFEEHRVLRALIFICGGLVALRVYSYCLAGTPCGLAAFLRFLSVGLLSPDLVYSVARPAAPRASLPRELLRMTVAGGTIAITSWLAMLLIFKGPGQHGWLVNHLILVVGFVIVMTAFGQANLGLWHLMGLRARPVIDRIWLARTPADFWRRWSWPIHLWLYRYIYLPCGGRRRAIRSVLAVFAFSGILHEMIAVVAIGRITGHQSAFFGVSAAGVLASPMLERIGRCGGVGEVLIRLVTLVFLAASAALMFVTVDAVIPMYATRWWLMW
jgi:hypothetical protein